MTTMTNEEEIEKTEDISEEQAEQAEQEAQPEQPEETEANEADKVAEELSAVKEQLVRTMAEYDNFRKRSQREKDALRTDIIVNVTSKFLPVMDNLERALSADCTDENYKSGVQMIYDSFMETLKNLGVEEIESDGADFSPNLHQAVQKIRSETVESGKVAQTFAKGYKIGDKVIRFAVVAVAE